MDPFAFSTQAREQMEGLFVRGMEEMLRNTRTLQDMSKTMEMGLEGKKMADSSIRQYLEMLNLPTRDDVTRILQYLQKIESRVIGLEEKVEDLGDHVRMMSQALMMAGQAVAAREAAQSTAPPSPTPHAAPPPTDSEPSTKAPAKKAAPRKAATTTKPVAKGRTGK